MTYKFEKTLPSHLRVNDSQHGPHFYKNVFNIFSYKSLHSISKWLGIGLIIETISDMEFPSRQSQMDTGNCLSLVIHQAVSHYAYCLTHYTTQTVYNSLHIGKVNGTICIENASLHNVDIKNTYIYIICYQIQIKRSFIESYTTHIPLVPHIYMSELGQHWFR